MAVVHRVDDRRGAERTVAGGEDLRVGGAHRVPVRRHLVVLQQPARAEVLRVGLLPDREHDHPAGQIVLRARDLDREPAAVRPGLAELGRPAAEREPVAARDDLDRLGVVDELDPLLDRAVELVLARGDLVGAAPVDDLHVLAPGEPARDPARVHRDVAGADDDRRARAASGRAPSFTARRNSTPSTTRGSSIAPANGLAHHAPIVSSTASCRSFSSSSVTSSPSPVSRWTVIPGQRASIRSMSSSKTARGQRNSGIPQVM